jgi:hypothetical protein
LRSCVRQGSAKNCGGNPWQQLDQLSLNQIAVIQRAVDDGAGRTGTAVLINPIQHRHRNEMTG